jgi:hypothetical protein
VNGYNEGVQSSVCFEDVNADGKRDLFIGNGAGGLSFFSSMGPNVGIEPVTASDLQNAVSFFPNPVTETLNIRIDQLEFSKGSVVITDIVGKEVLSRSIEHSMEMLDLSGLEAGIYFATLVLETNSRSIGTTQKIIKNR